MERMEKKANENAEKMSTTATVIEKNFKQPVVTLGTTFVQQESKLLTAGTIREVAQNQTDMRQRVATLFTKSMVGAPKGPPPSVKRPGAPPSGPPPIAP